MFAVPGVDHPRLDPWRNATLNPSTRSFGNDETKQRAPGAAASDRSARLWNRIRREAEDMARHDPLMASTVHCRVLQHPTLAGVIGSQLAHKLATAEIPVPVLEDLAQSAYAEDPALIEAAQADILVVHDRDPACHRLIQAVLFFKGFLALQAYRLSNFLWSHERKDSAYFIQMRTSEVFGIDIHPAARIGRGVMLDHAHAIVIGETAVVGNNVTILHSVTLGGTGKEVADRHPKIGDDVLIGAGAVVLGNIRVGGGARIAAGSVVLKEVPPNQTVAGVPAKIVGKAGSTSLSRISGRPRDAA